MRKDMRMSRFLEETLTQSNQNVLAEESVKEDGGHKSSPSLLGSLELVFPDRTRQCTTSDACLMIVFVQRATPSDVSQAYEALRELVTLTYGDKAKARNGWINKLHTALKTRADGARLFQIATGKKRVVSKKRKGPELTEEEKQKRRKKVNTQPLQIPRQNDPQFIKAVVSKTHIGQHYVEKPGLEKVSKPKPIAKDSDLSGMRKDMPLKQFFEQLMVPKNQLVIRRETAIVGDAKRRPPSGSVLGATELVYPSIAGACQTDVSCIKNLLRLKLTSDTMIVVLKALKPLAQLIHRHSINSESDFFSDVRVQAKSIPGWTENLGEEIKLAFAVEDESVVLRANSHIHSQQTLSQSQSVRVSESESECQS
jgi:hypothetical protein